MILAVAACEDIAGLKVSNRLIVAGWGIAFLFRLHDDGLYGILYWILGVIVPVFLLYALFLFRMLGAGDIKLISVIGGFCGVVFCIRVFIFALFAGGVLCFFKCIHYGYLLNRLRYFTAYFKDILLRRTIKAYYIRERDGTDIVIPFSAAIGIGFLAAYGM